MTKDELYTQLLDEALEEDTLRINSHAQWMAQVIINLRNDPAYKKLHASTREEIEQIVAAVE